MPATLSAILAASVLAGVCSVLVAAVVSWRWLPRRAERLLAYPAGVLAAFALCALAPEAVHLGLAPERVGQGLMLGIVVFFLLEKLILRLHGQGATTASGPHASSPQQVALVVLGDGLHNFVDGVLIAAAYLVEPALGWATALAVLAHELPQEIGDFTILLAAGVGRARAVALNAFSGLGTVLGAFAGYASLGAADAYLPYVLVAAAASFLYLSMASLIPVLQRQQGLNEDVLHLALLMAGVATVAGVGWALPHEH